MPEARSGRDRCERFRSDASLRLDGELPLLDAALHVAHAARCPACRVHAAELAAIAGRIRGAPAERPARRVSVPTACRVTWSGRAAAALALAVLLVVSAGAARVEPAPMLALAGGSGCAKAV